MSTTAPPPTTPRRRPSARELALKRHQQLMEQLVTAAVEGDLPGMDAALDAGAHIDGAPANSRSLKEHYRSSSLGGRTAVQCVSVHGPLPALRHLLDRGANPNAVGPLEPLPAAWLSLKFNGNPLALEMLLDAGADVHWRNEKGQTLLHRAVTTNNPAAMALLQHRGLSWDVQDHEGNSLMHHAAIDHQAPVMLLLARAGADLNARNHQGQRPIDLARSHGTVHTLVALGCDIPKVTYMVPFLMDAAKASPLANAVTVGQVDVVQAILERHPDTSMDELQRALARTAKAPQLAPIRTLLQSVVASRAAHDALASILSPEMSRNAPRIHP